jgi:hypothetical protein
MRINNVGPQVVISPEVRSAVDQVRATQPVGAQAASAYTGGRILVETMEVRQAPPVIEERRQAPRRGIERRQQQAAVTIDTRVGERRVTRRRANDEPANSIDVVA